MEKCEYEQNGLLPMGCPGLITPRIPPAESRIVFPCSGRTRVAQCSYSDNKICKYFLRVAGGNSSTALPRELSSVLQA